jgi:molybdate transport system substrate-binding protein
MLRTISQPPSHSPRRGAINCAVLALLASAIVLVVLTLALSRSGGPPKGLTIICAAGLREPMEAIRAIYEKEHGAHLAIQYGGSATLLANLHIHHDTDLFLPADDSYIEVAKTDSLVTETFPIAQMRPILAVKKSNPLGIHSFDDLLTKNVRISMTDPSAAATGKLVQIALEKTDQWNAFKPRVTVFKATVTEVAADLQVGAVDAGIIWDAMLKQLSDLEEVPLPELSGVAARVVAGIVANSKNQHSARDFATFLAAPDKGQRYFLNAGFTPTEARNAN